MSSTTAPVVGGNGFTEVLHEGLVRAAARMSPRPRPGSASATPLPVASPVLEAGETEAVLDRFAARLTGVLVPAEAEVPELRASLREFAHAVLDRACGRDGSAGPQPTPIPPPLASPHQVTAAAALLLECALLHVLESGIAHNETGLLRAATVARRLGESLRAATEEVWAGNDGWNERRRVARQLHDELGGALSDTRLSLDAAVRDPGARAAHLAAAVRSLTVAERENRALIDGARSRCDLPPLREALEGFLSQLRTRDGLSGDAGVRTCVQVIGDERVLTERYRVEVYFALREALRDRVTRSGAQHVTAVVRVNRRWLYAKVTDDGRRPAEGAAADLRFLTERVEDLGGRTDFGAGAGPGTVLEIHLPLRHH
ncbi:sensor histidine kinase [Streptomyces sp. NPDC050743]|uniref:sensor histidine kinase n=1 Tax=Streptomyces sp. NPDC050743 TaxID=3365634 RepID=UPI0037887E79